MKHNCPYCGASLKLRLVLAKPLPGERKIFPHRAIQVCPTCSGQLASNIHWSELVAGVAIALSLLLFLRLRDGMPVQSAITWSAGVLFCWLGLFAFFSRTLLAP